MKIWFIQWSHRDNATARIMFWAFIVIDAHQGIADVCTLSVL